MTVVWRGPKWLKKTARWLDLNTFDRVVSIRIDESKLDFSDVELIEQFQHLGQITLMRRDDKRHGKACHLSTVVPNLYIMDSKGAVLTHTESMRNDQAKPSFLVCASKASSPDLATFACP